MSSSDGSMVKVMGMVIAALILFTLFCVSVARLLAGGSAHPEDSLMRQALMQRIEPVGKVRTSEEELPQTASAEGAGGSDKSGDELVQGVCASCHAGGVGGAPKLDDDAAWAERRDAGLETLVASVVNGKGSMPARGGSQYSDEEIERAVRAIAGFEEEAGGEEQADAGGGDSDADGSSEEAADAGGSQEDEETAKASGSDEDGSEEGGDADAAGSAEDDGNSGEASADGGDSAGGGDLVATIGSGQAPEGMSDEVKTAVDGICSGCHVAGVANAPKLGDKEAWQPRVEAGLDALTQSVIQGKNAMPPMGGSQLAEEDMAIAVRYLLTKQ